jgi:mannitol/fructose-specific phosphotransferase system IIA component (Ntr-type)
MDMKNLQTMLNKDTVLLKAEVADWEAAVRLSGQVLVDGGAVEPRYIDCIIKNTHDLGPYYVLAPGLAMPHCRPEDGVIETGLSMVTLKNPVNFGHVNDPVSIVLCLAAKDNTAHLAAMRQMALLFSDDEVSDRIRDAGTIDDVVKILDRLDDSN